MEDDRAIEISLPGCVNIFVLIGIVASSIFILSEWINKEDNTTLFIAKLFVTIFMNTIIMSLFIDIKYLSFMVNKKDESSHVDIKDIECVKIDNQTLCI